MNDKKLPRYMMATKAMHNVGDISRDEEDYCYIKEQTEEGYVGSWVTGYGFFGVVFPFETTRELTAEEQGYIENTDVIIV